MKILRPVYQLTLNATTSSFAENVVVKFNGIQMTSLDGNVVQIKGRNYHTLVEQAGGGNLTITIDVVNEGDAIEERIDYMLEEEYEIEPLVDVFTKSTNTQIPWTVDFRRSYQTEKMMDMDMAPGVKDAVSFITSAAVGFSDEFTANLVQELNTGKYQHVLDFINTLADM